MGRKGGREGGREGCRREGGRGREGEGKREEEVHLSKEDGSESLRLTAHSQLKPFLDAHFAAFKPGHQYWFGLLLVIRAAMPLSAVIPTDSVRIVVFVFALMSVLLIYWGQRVYS